MTLDTFIPKALHRGTTQLGNLHKRLNGYAQTAYKSPNTNFMPILNERLPSKTSFTLVRNVSDFGINKIVPDNSKFALRNPDPNLLLREQIVNPTSFKRSSGIVGLDEYFDKMTPNVDYSYIDPQYYQYKLQGQTLQSQIQNKWKSDNETDIDNLDPTTRASRFVKERYDNAANKIKSNYLRHREQAPYQQVTQSLKADEVPLKNIYDLDRKESQEIRSDFREGITVQKARRKHTVNEKRFENKQNYKKELQNTITSQPEYENALEKAKAKLEQLNEKYKPRRQIPVKTGYNAEQRAFAEASQQSKNAKNEQKKRDKELIDEYEKQIEKEKKKKRYEDGKKKLNDSVYANKSPARENFAFDNSTSRASRDAFTEAEFQAIGKPKTKPRRKSEGNLSKDLIETYDSRINRAAGGGGGSYRTRKEITVGGEEGDELDKLMQSAEKNKKDLAKTLSALRIENELKGEKQFNSPDKPKDVPKGKALTIRDTRKPVQAFPVIETKPIDSVREDLGITKSDATSVPQKLQDYKEEIELTKNLIQNENPSRKAFSIIGIQMYDLFKEQFPWLKLTKSTTVKLLEERLKDTTTLSNLISKNAKKIAKAEVKPSRRSPRGRFEAIVPSSSEPLLATDNSLFYSDAMNY